jgi:putative membrane protein insertion efficiency factor
VTRLLVALIRFYQGFSRLTPPVCRFRPTCSEYAVQALQEHGAWRGLWMTVCRLSKCHPFHPGGYDPVR